MAEINSKIFFATLLGMRLPIPEAEFRFHPTRKFRFDFAWPEFRLGLEIDGGIWTGGRHVRPKGFLRDQEKTNLAAVEGWAVLRVTPQDFQTGAVYTTLKSWFANRGGESL
jgi:very-short-patch-repair endonuclease